MRARMRAPLGRAALFAALLTCLTGSQVCPRSLDCARAGRHFCPPGSSQCGPCLAPLVETSRGRCVVRRRPAPRPAQTGRGEVSRYPELDEEIDFLSAVISEHRTVSKAASLHPSGPEPSPAAPTELPQSQRVTPPTSAPSATPDLLGEPVILAEPPRDHAFVVVSAVCIVAGSAALALAGACWVRLQKGVGRTQKMDPLYGLMRAQTFDALPGDKRLAHSAQMFHYQHQKQQMLSMEKHRDEPKVPDSGASTDEENEDGDFTVYECPGLAPTGEMEVKNPLFDDSTLYFQRFHQ